MAHYRFVSRWVIEAPPEDLFDALRDYRTYPAWWPYVGAMREVEPGDPGDLGSVVRCRVRTPRGYSLEFDVRLVRSERPRLLAGDVTGDLAGQGVCRLESDGTTTTCRFTWEVSTTKAWMNVVAPAARPLFGWAHRIVMRRGARGLCDYLGVGLVRAG